MIEHIYIYIENIQRIIWKSVQEFGLCSAWQLQKQNQGVLKNYSAKIGFFYSHKFMLFPTLLYTFDIHCYTGIS
jgi:hypothetical protein